MRQKPFRRMMVSYLRESNKLEDIRIEQRALQSRPLVLRTLLMLRNSSEFWYRSLASSSDRKSSALSRRHLLNPGYLTTAVACRHIHCLFRQQQVKTQLEDSALHSAENLRYSQFCRNITSSFRRARQKTWPEGVAERRGRKAWLKDVVGWRGRMALPDGVGQKTCLPESRMWQQLAPCGLQPSPVLEKVKRICR